MSFNKFYKILVGCLLSVVLVINVSFLFDNSFSGEKNVLPPSVPVEEVVKEEPFIKDEKIPDMVGTIKIDGTKIDEVVVQGKDNEYYLNHNEKKKKDIKGATFLDYRVNLDSKKKLIYSHNSSTLDVPFQDLEKYYKKSFFEEHRYIKFRSEKGTKTYEVFSVFIETKDWSYMQVSFNTDEAWLEHLTYLKNKSFYDTGVEVKKEDNIIILQTCSHHKDYKKYKNKYLLVIGKEI